MSDVVTNTGRRFPLGAGLTVETLDTDPYPALARLRESEPVSWVPVLDGWLVTRRDLCIEVMRDARVFTVDDPRFSTSQVVGPSMLSLDGDEHRRHRDPFAKAFLGPEAKARFADRIQAEARRLVEALTPAGTAEIRRELAGPLAVNVVAAALELADAEPAVVLGWYDEIVAAVDRVSVGGEIGAAARLAVRALGRHVAGSVEDGRGVLSTAAATLAPPEVVSNAAVMMFGGIPRRARAPASSALLASPTRPGPVRRPVPASRSLLPNAVGVAPARACGSPGSIACDGPISSSQAPRPSGRSRHRLAEPAANRDPATFPDPDTFVADAAQRARSHLAFAQGPHACVGIHLARMETQAALDAALDAWPGLRLEAGATPPTGVIFRKPRTLRIVGIQV